MHPSWRLTSLSVVPRHLTLHFLLPTKACNYFELASIDNGTCTYRKPLHDCSGQCEVEVDCKGICGGNSSVDQCGICGGNGFSCVGCVDTSACNFDPKATIAAAESSAKACVYRKPFHNCAGECLKTVRGGIDMDGMHGMHGMDGGLFVVISSGMVTSAPVTITVSVSDSV